MEPGALAGSERFSKSVCEHLGNASMEPGALAGSEPSVYEGGHLLAIASMEPGALAGSECLRVSDGRFKLNTLQWSPALWPGVSRRGEVSWFLVDTASMEPGALAGSELALTRRCLSEAHSFNGARRFGRE